MTNRYSISTTLEPPRAGGAEATWAGRELSAKQAVVRDKRILLVDDAAPLRGCLRMMLEFDDHQVTEASNGAEALSLFTVGEFDLVITDFEMPVMDGHEFAASLKLLAPSLPILMITASERVADDIENSVDALLYKPFSVSDLRCALRKLLSARPDVAETSAVLA